MAASNTTLRFESYTFGCDDGTELLTTAKRYTSTIGTSEDGLTLVFAHSIGSRELYLLLANRTLNIC